jgi:hypothetical protein
MRSAKDWFGAMLKGAAVLAMVLGLSTAAGAQEKTATKKAAPKAAAKEPAAPKKAAAKAEAGETKLTKKDVPAAVIAAFEKAYPKATMKGFSKEVEKGQTLYEVESVEGKMTRDATYAADGKVHAVEESMDMKDVPAAVQQALEKKYPKAKVDLAEKVTEGNNVGYEFKLITAAGKKAEAKFDAKGKEEKP